MYEISYVDGPLRGRTSSVPVLNPTIVGTVGSTTVIYSLREGSANQYAVNATLTEIQLRPRPARKGARGKVTQLPPQRAPRTVAAMHARSRGRRA